MTDQERYDRFLEDLERLVGMDSGSDDLDGVARVAAFLAGRLEALGLETGISRQGEAGVPCLAAHTPLPQRALGPAPSWATWTRSSPRARRPGGRFACRATGPWDRA